MKKGKNSSCSSYHPAVHSFLHILLVQFILQIVLVQNRNIINSSPLSRNDHLCLLLCLYPSSMRWQYDRRFPQLVYSRRLPTSAICRSQSDEGLLLPLPVPLDFDAARRLCTRLGGGNGQLAVFNTLADWQLAWDNHLANQATVPENVFFPFRRALPNETFRYVYDPAAAIKIPWYEGQPNAGNENCVGCNRGGCINMYCSLPTAVICSFPSHLPRLLLRGNCADSEMDTHFHPARRDGSLIWIGLTGTFIRYEAKEGRWAARVLRSEVWAASEAVESSLLVGTTAWQLFQNRRCTDQSEENRTLSLTGCGPTEFNCDSGDCIALDARCDGVGQCADGSDESGCSVLQDPHDYNKAMSPPLPQLTASVDLLNIIKLDEANSKIRLKLRISLEWADDRLRFLNLRANRVQNSLSADEAAEIWQPALILDNVELTDYDLNVAPAVTAVRNESYGFYLTGLSELYNARVYDGSANRLCWSETVRSENSPRLFHESTVQIP